MPERSRVWSERFRYLFLNNRFVLFLFVLLLIGLNIMIFNHVSYIFNPLIALIKTVVLPLILSGVVYYLVNPLVDDMERRGIKRIYGILILYLLIISLIVIAVVAVIPLIRNQITSLIENIPDYSEDAQQKIKQWTGSDFFSEVQATLGFHTADLTKTITSRASDFFANAWTRIGGVLGVVTEVVLAAVTLPFILFYLLKNGRDLPRFILQFIPTGLRKETRRVMVEMNDQIASYIRGQIIVSFCIGGLLYIGYLIIGLEYSLVLAIMAACTSIVPYLGPVIAITPALIVATVTSPAMLLKMVVVWTIVQLVEGKFISPQIMGKTLRIHPVTIIFVILTAGNLFGILGIIVAVPGYAVLKVICTHVFHWIQLRSGLYPPDDLQESTTKSGIMLSKNSPSPESEQQE
ncbi:AI-2E family transporter [Paenibacillus sepulcri]|uniref:AI-2E family transporter n=1 Tax=Paenibacillus sepulcri TaxID=359917 RepID=A0ABS7C8J6_9BACL|nr:AI-2E family transporter [Paenibacillus sepulcri]